MELRTLDLGLNSKSECSDSWTYRGEGNANVILALNGQNKVLRLKKSLKSDAPVLPKLGKNNETLDLLLDKKELVNLPNLVEYNGENLPNNASPASYTCTQQSVVQNGSSNNIVHEFMGTKLDEQIKISRSILERCIWESRWWKTFTKLLGTCYTIRDNEKIEIVDLTSCNLSKLNQKLDLLRPEYRRHKLVASEYAVMFPDFTLMPDTDYLCYGDTFTFELKPKHGWTPYVINENESSEYAKCPYCLTQFLKFKKGKINKISGYCPLDLFSGNIQRMTKALRSIIEVPQNNFKVFRNGHAVDRSDLKMLLEDLFQTSFTTDNADKNMFREYSQILKEDVDGQLLQKTNYDCTNDSEQVNYSQYNINNIGDTLKDYVHESQSNSHKKLKTSHCSDSGYSKQVNFKSSFNVLSKLASLICVTLLKNFNAKEDELNATCLNNQTVHYDSSKHKYLRKLHELGLKSCQRNNYQSNLPQGCILERLLRLQLLDCDVTLETLSKGKGYEYIEGTLKVLEDPKRSLNDLTDLERSMMAATVKDCSVMLTFRRIRDEVISKNNKKSTNFKSLCCGDSLNGFCESMQACGGVPLENFENQIVELNGQKFMARVSVIDLDLKPESRIDNYLKHIQDMFEATLEFLNKQKSDSQEH